MKRFFCWCIIVELIFLCGCSNQNYKIAKLSETELDVLYQQEFERFSDRLPGEVQFDFASLSYGKEIYTTSQYDLLDYIYLADNTSAACGHTMDDYPLEKICDVYGQVFIKPTYGNLNDDGRYADVYAWYDDISKVDGEFREGILWKFGEYDPSNLLALTSQEIDKQGNIVYKLMIFYHLNNVNITSGEELLNIIFKIENAQYYSVAGKPDTLHNLSTDKNEDISVLKDFCKSKVVSETSVSDANKYDTICITEKEPYRRTILFRDYGNGVIGYCTPEGKVLYFKMQN